LGQKKPDEKVVQVYFDKLFELLKKKTPLSYHARISLACHRLNSLLQPVDNELYNLRETGFAQPHWDEIVKDYSGGAGTDILQKARSWVYAIRPDQDAIERVVLEAGLEFPKAKAEIDSAWAELTALLPKEDEPAGSTVGEILLKMGEPGGLEAVRERCQSYNNDFHKWVTSLREKLEGLQHALPEK
jgi:hypothetical protein